MNCYAWMLLGSLNTTRKCSVLLTKSKHWVYALGVYVCFSFKYVQDVYPLSHEGAVVWNHISESVSQIHKTCAKPKPLSKKAVVTSTNFLTVTRKPNFISSFRTDL